MRRTARHEAAWRRCQACFSPSPSPPRPPRPARRPQTNEIRNGRLAMIACLGMAAQGVMTKEGPYANLLAHLSDPVGNNLLTSEWPAAARA